MTMEKLAKAQSWWSGSSLLDRMRPSICLMGESNYSVDDEKALDDTMPNILRAMNHPAERSDAITRLWKLTNDVENRVPIVCTSRWDVLDGVIECIEDEGESLRTACLVLNNLSVQMENKAVMALGLWGDRLITALLTIMQKDLPETYLCCTCLNNLAILGDAVDLMLFFAPPAAENLPEQRQSLPPKNKSKKRRSIVLPPLPTPMPPTLQNQQSLIRTVEKTLQKNAPFLLASVTSTQGEALRRSCHLLRNLAAHEKGPPLLTLTSIPNILISFIQNTNRPVVKWTSGSLEEAALATLCHLARDSCSRDVLAPIDPILDPIISEGGIHAYRASAIRSSLDS